MVDWSELTYGELLVFWCDCLEHHLHPVNETGGVIVLTYLCSGIWHKILHGRDGATA